MIKFLFLSLVCFLVFEYFISNISNQNGFSQMVECPTKWGFKMDHPGEYYDQDCFFVTPDRYDYQCPENYDLQGPVPSNSGHTHICVEKLRDCPTLTGYYERVPVFSRCPTLVCPEGKFLGEDGFCYSLSESPYSDPSLYTFDELPVEETSNSKSSTKSPVHGWTPSSFGLTENNIITAEYGEDRVYKENKKFKCTIATTGCIKGPTDYIKKHEGIDFSTRNQDGTPAALPFKSGFSGKVILIPGSSYNTIGVLLPNNHIVQYLHASEILVTTGQEVTPDTILGKSGKKGAEDIHLHIQVRDPKNKIIDPRSIP